jgi:hypothetical protein
VGEGKGYYYEDHEKYWYAVVSHLANSLRFNFFCPGSQRSGYNNGDPGHRGRRLYYLRPLDRQTTAPWQFAQGAVDYLKDSDNKLLFCILTEIKILIDIF